ncbi:MAG: hypothetical protein HS126_02310 [Anaerolineales bacterium]|nr:hypothetical protein [Anaerolineales bacterium]
MKEIINWRLVKRLILVWRWQVGLLSGFCLAFLLILPVPIIAKVWPPDEIYDVAWHELKDAKRLAEKFGYNFGTMEQPTRAAEKLLRKQDELAERLAEELADLKLELTNSRIDTTPAEIRTT